jgi:hypothetical protein
MLRKAPDTGIPLRRGQFMSEGYLESGGGSYAGNFEWWMKEGSGNGASLSEGTAWAGPGGRAPLLVNPNDVLKRHIKRDVKMPRKWVSLYLGAPLGNLEGIHFPELFERKR